MKLVIFNDRETDEPLCVNADCISDTGPSDDALADGYQAAITLVDERVLQVSQTCDQVAEILCSV